MEFALMVEPQLGMTYEGLHAAAAYAESRRLAALARSDHYGFDGFERPHATDAFASLAGLARDTSEVGLVVLVSPVTFRHPAVIARNAVTIDEMSGGRLSLGVGTGWLQSEHDDHGIAFPATGERFAMLGEALAYLHHAFGRREGPFAGDRYAIHGPVRPAPTGPLPLIVGGDGPRRTPELAGRLADEYNLFVGDRAGMEQRIARAREAADQAGRDSAALRISVMTTAVVGSDEAGFRRNLATVAAADPFGRTADQILAGYRRRGRPVGTESEARETVTELAGLGVGRIYLQHFGPFEPGLLDETFGVLGG